MHHFLVVQQSCWSAIKMSLVKVYVWRLDTFEYVMSNRSGLANRFNTALEAYRVLSQPHKGIVAQQQASVFRRTEATAPL